MAEEESNEEEGAPCGVGEKESARGGNTSAESSKRPPTPYCPTPPSPLPLAANADEVEDRALGEAAGRWVGEGVVIQGLCPAWVRPEESAAQARHMRLGSTKEVKVTLKEPMIATW